MDKIIELTDRLIEKLNHIGEFLPLLAIRVLIAYEFFDAGVEKLKGQNWFAQIQDQFPFPFNLIHTDISWFLATWSEILASIAILVGFATRFSALSLIILDLVAWYSVHADSGYNVCSNGFKLPLVYLVLLLPLLFMGPGRASIDELIAKKYL
ncbi:MAG: DoxX family protein [Gammaproteobacteria bacterium]|nr:DoxX family protein [Gammaproteobacteria bacterium]